MSQEHTDTRILDVKEFDLRSIAELEDTALGLVLTELQQEEQMMASHSSHSSYSTHGTNAW